MTLLRMRELRALSDEDLRRKIADAENDLLRERGVAAMGGAPPSPGRMRALRTNVARALTVLRERSLVAERTGPRGRAEGSR
jgi:large subunit ribosomal protein L29